MEKWEIWANSTIWLSKWDLNPNFVLVYNFFIENNCDIDSAIKFNIKSNIKVELPDYELIELYSLFIFKYKFILLNNYINTCKSDFSVDKIIQFILVSNEYINFLNILNLSNDIEQTKELFLKKFNFIWIE